LKLKDETMSYFDKALALVLEHEGGFVDHPRDPGGATNFGITLNTFRTYIGKSDASVGELKRISAQRVAEIYRNGYWNKIAGDRWSAGVAIMLFDTAVNCGPSRALKILQASAGTRPDGLVGPATRAAVAKKPARELIEEFAARRAHYYGRLSTFSTFGLGWSRRLMRTLIVALEGECGDVSP
jgi:lysozyme family protein